MVGIKGQNKPICHVYCWGGGDNYCLRCLREHYLLACFAPFGTSVLALRRYDHISKITLTALHMHSSGWVILGHRHEFHQIDLELGHLI